MNKDIKRIFGEVMEGCETTVEDGTIEGKEGIIIKTSWKGYANGFFIAGKNREGLEDNLIAAYANDVKEQVDEALKEKDE